jgi:monofunctional biosynthetic peptidoglycan transglycosylase
MRMQKQRLRKNGKSDSLLHTFIELDSISPALIKAVLAAEDDGFFAHPGFDAAAIARAIEHNRRYNRHKRGASTITQQMAKNLFAGGEKTFKRKYEELAYAILMEWFLGKERILELYMNYAQWGENIFGCEAAAKHYYNKSSRHLSFAQAAHLAAVLAKPSRLSPHYTESSFMRKRLSVIANNLYLKKSIDTATWSALSTNDSSNTENREQIPQTISQGNDIDTAIQKTDSSGGNDMRVEF